MRSLITVLPLLLLLTQDATPLTWLVMARCSGQVTNVAPVVSSGVQRVDTGEYEIVSWANDEVANTLKIDYRRSTVAVAQFNVPAGRNKDVGVVRGVDVFSPVALSLDAQKLLYRGANGSGTQHYFVGNVRDGTSSVAYSAKGQGSPKWLADGLRWVTLTARSSRPVMEIYENSRGHRSRAFGLRGLLPFSRVVAQLSSGGLVLDVAHRGKAITLQFVDRLRRGVGVKRLTVPTPEGEAVPALSAIDVSRNGKFVALAFTGHHLRPKSTSLVDHTTSEPIHTDTDWLTMYVYSVEPGATSSVGYFRWDALTDRGSPDILISPSGRFLLFWDINSQSFYRSTASGQRG